jgi:NCAIR mutase (PurE)-related protein
LRARLCTGKLLDFPVQGHYQSIWLAGGNAVVEKDLRALLTEIKAGKLSVSEGIERLRHLPFEDLGFAKIDHHRVLRQGFPEVVFGRGKTVTQIETIVKRMLSRKHNVLVTRTEEKVFRRIQGLSPSARFYQESGTILIVTDDEVRGKGTILVVSAGTADIPVAQEAVVTAQAMGNRVETLFDVGVAGIHRLLAARDKLLGARVVIVAAGMEGALPSVVGGLVSVPVVAVPTSIGYGASFGGVAALLGMLNSCASNVSVVNIDNGYGAGFVASLINRL